MRSFSVRQPLPPLNGLRVFEVVARVGSISGAAEELGVTPGAISHQLKGLEGHLGVRLFDRKAKRLSLTPTALRYARQLSEGFDQLSRATEMVRREVSGRSATVSATPALALRWLAPALDKLRQEGITEFRIISSSRQADLLAGEAELDLRYGRTIEAKLVSDVLFSEKVFPVCHPAYAGKLKLRSAGHLVRASLLFVDDWGNRGGHWSAWREWFELTNLPLEKLNEGGRFAAMDSAVAFAAKGKGVAMGADRHLKQYSAGDGLSLVRIFPKNLYLEYCAFLVALPEVAEEKTIKHLRMKLVALAKKSGPVLHVGEF